MKNLKIQSATRADTAALQTIVTETGLFPPDALPSMLDHVLNDPDTGIWLASHSGSTITGMCYSVPETLADGVWNMLALAILPNQQQSGHGSALVGAMEDALIALNQRMVIVETSSTPDFSGARQFYASLGYDEEARLRDFWSAGDDKIIFRKMLT